MKTAIVFLALVSVAFSAPQARKSFHEHYADFWDLIMEESSQELMNLANQYAEFEEFQSGLQYLSSKDFKNLIYEMEDLPEFKAVVDFLEGHNIDILFFIDKINEMLESFDYKRGKHQVSGSDFSSFIRDSVELFPKDKLIALYNKKIEEDEAFARAMADLESEEFEEVFQALLENESFEKETEALLEHGFDVHIFFYQIKALFGKF